jgi:Spy/CpxP family protein refolding chaperone
MLRTRSNWLVASVLGFTLVAAAGVRAAENPTGLSHHRADMMSRLQQSLGLTDEQVKAIQEVNGRYAESRKQTWQTLRQKQRELRQMALNGSDPAAIHAKTAEVAQLLSQAITLRVQSLQEIAPLLTQEQRNKLAQMGPAMHWRRGGQQPQGS